MSDLRTLLEAAKADGPSAAARAKVWSGVSSAVGGAAMSSTGAAGLTAAGSSVKMLVLGTLLGGTLTVGIGATMLFVGRAPPVRATAGLAIPAPAGATQSVAPRVPAAPSTIAGLAGAGDVALAASGMDPSIAPFVPHASNASNAMPVIVPLATRATLPMSTVAAMLVTPGESSRRSSTRAPSPRLSQAAQDDALAREASLLASARNALSRRDALTALEIVRGLRALPARQLVPEELAVEAQALRGLGLDDEATAVDATLRARFPDSVLGR